MSPSPSPSLREPLLTFCAAIGLAAALFWTGRAVPFVRQNLQVGVALIFFYAPVVAGRVSGRHFDFREAGLRLDPVAPNLTVLGAVTLLTLPLFVAAFFAFYDAACAPMPVVAGSVVRGLGRLCPAPPGTGGAGWTGLAGGHLRLPPRFLLLALNQVLVVALPEELFFRGYLLGRLHARWPARRRFLGAPVGAALLTSALLFALGHFLVDFNPQRLAVFFPALVFGWMRARTGSIAAGTAYHAFCNLLSEVLHSSYF